MPTKSKPSPKKKAQATIPDLQPGKDPKGGAKANVDQAFLRRLRKLTANPCDGGERMFEHPGRGNGRAMRIVGRLMILLRIHPPEITADFLTRLDEV